jgi:3-oxoacyl-[acyl-carrier protein] reductase
LLAVTLLPGYAAYAASKAAVEAMLQVTSTKELGPARVTVNCVAPGPVATELFFQGKSRAPHGAPFAKLNEHLLACGDLICW